MRSERGSCLRLARAEDDGERRQAAQDQAVAVRPGERIPVDGEPQAGVAAEQGLEGDLSFEPGQRSAEAVMDPVAEPEVRPSRRPKSRMSGAGKRSDRGWLSRGTPVPARARGSGRRRASPARRSPGTWHGAPGR